MSEKNKANGKRTYTVKGSVSKDKDKLSKDHNFDLTIERDCGDEMWDACAVAHLKVMAQNKVIRPELKANGRIASKYTFKASELASRGGVVPVTKDTVKDFIKSLMAQGMTKEEAIAEVMGTDAN